MDDWTVVKHEDTRGNNQPLLLLINDKCLAPLKACDYKLKFGLRYARVKVFQASSGDDVDETGGLQEDLHIEVQEQLAHKTLQILQINLKQSMNARHEIWGSTEINERGECLFGFICSSNQELCNKGRTPTFVFPISDSHEG